MSWSGGCQCGKVRFRVDGELSDASVCHCRMCQKAMAGPFGAFVAARPEDLTWTRGEPARFQSSRTIQRGFCRDCGTPLTFEGGKKVGLAMFALDRAAELAPEMQLVPESAPAWLATVCDLEVLPAPPGYLEQIESYQHPDCDT